MESSVIDFDSSTLFTFPALPPQSNYLNHARAVTLDSTPEKDNDHGTRGPWDPTSLARPCKGWDDGTDLVGQCWLRGKVGEEEREDGGWVSLDRYTH